jgi:hypothetical protein
MTQRVENLSLFGDDVNDDGDEILLLPQQQVLEFLGNMKCAPTIVLLREEVYRLRQIIHSLADDEPQHQGENIEIAKPFLFGELEQIASTHTLERAVYYVERLIKAVTEVRTSKINDINLNRWKQYEDILTDSLWVINKRDSTGSHSAGYWGNFIPQIPNQMMRRYTKKGEWVLDTFAGSGTTLIEGQRLGRNTIGIELQQSVRDKAQRVVSSEPNPYDTVAGIHVGSSTDVDYRKILSEYGQKSVQLVISHPPYFDIIKFSQDPQDLSNAPSVQDFLLMMGQVVENAARVLDRGRYFVLVIGDKYDKGEWIPLGFQTMNEVVRQGFTLKSIIVKNFEETTGKRNQKELWRYRALVGGFYVFKHEYIFIFKKD